MHVRANFRSIPRLLGRVVISLALLLILLLAVAWALIRASVPQLNGRIALPGLQAPLSIGRDALGTAILQGSQRLDLARGLGFVHAQERFFEMDLTRRSAAGELSALFGVKALERDKQRRLHRMRARLSERFAELPTADRALLEAYAAGVNAGLAAQTVRPWQYLLLRDQPEAWTPVDSLLVVSEMFWMLQGTGLDAGFERAQLRERAGDALFDWLNPRGGNWDAALDGSTIARAISLPTPEQFDLRGPAGAAAARATSPSIPPRPSALNSTAEAPVIGSNNWAIAGSRNAHGDGAALLADDMHLGLGVPSIWYRAQLQLGTTRAVGLTLPGMPSLVVGSNGAVAWGFTNAYGQWFDWIKLPTDLPDSALQQFTETIAVKGEASQTLQVREFKGAPIVRTQDLQGGQGKQNYALRWIAHQGQAFNLNLDHLLLARNVDEAIPIAQGAGIPHQNILLADAQGHIAWTIAGRLWTQAGVAQSYARFQAPDVAPHTWTPNALYPRVKDPTDGQLWTANNRQIGGESLGDGGFDLGARAQQIRDRLREHATHDEQSLAAIHLDNEARFLKTWGQRLNQALATDAKYAAVATQLQAWNGRADADQVGYRLIRAVRLKTLDTLWTAWTLPLLGEQQLDEKRRLPWRAQFEYSASAALDQQPAHLLPKGFANWNALLLAQVDAAVQELTHSGQQALTQATWGQHNTSHIQHVLSKAIPALAPFLDMPARPQGGDSNLPHVAAAAFGQSERLVVSPGHEDRATLSMPCGQSGHPLSPFYGAGHQNWVEAKPTPLLAGPALHHLEAVPAR